MTAPQLRQQATRRSDTEAAQQMQRAKATLLTACQRQRHPHLSPAAGGTRYTQLPKKGESQQE